MVRFYLQDAAGHAAVQVEINDEDIFYSEASASFTFYPVLAGELDKFVSQLKAVEKAQSGEAILENSAS